MKITKPFSSQTQKLDNIRSACDALVKINFDIQSLNMFCAYLISDNSYIRASHVSNMKRLFDRIDMDAYRTDPEKLHRIDFIKRGLEARVVRKLKNRQIIRKYIEGSFVTDKTEYGFVDTLDELSTNEIDWINDTISETTKFSFMYDYCDRFMDICTRFKAEDYAKRSDIVNEFEALVDDVKKEFRRVRNESATEMEFSLAEGIFEEVIQDVYQKEINPSRRLVTGMQGFNEIVGGGLESGRVYMLFGMAGAGKSLTMLNIAYQIKKYNKNYVCKDPTKKPCIAILTMENSVHETVTRLYSLVAGEQMGNCTSVDDAIRKLREDGELSLNDDSPIDIIIKFKPNMSIDTSYLYTLYDDLDERGYEMILLMQDHIKRIRPQFPKHDLRLDLGENVNDFKVFAIEKDIPVMSDSHLNRDGAKIIDSASMANKSDVTKLLGKGNVGESMLMIDNTDCGIILNKEYDRNGNEWMIFYRQKMRDFCTKRDYVAQPFVEGSTIRLKEDYDLPVPVFRDSLYEPATLEKKKKDSYSDGIKNYDDDDDMSTSLFANPGVAPQQISLSNMNCEIIGAPSIPVYPITPIINPMDEQSVMDDMSQFGFFDMAKPPIREGITFVQ